jgi:two-component system cell cycle sensor histidine kinase/response regulator CckA
MDRRRTKPRSTTRAPCASPAPLDPAVVALADQSNVGVALEEDERIIYANDALTRLAGLRRERIVGKSLLQVMEVVLPEDRERLLERMRVRLAEPAAVLPAFDLRVQDAVGGVRWLSFTGSWVEVGGRRLRQVVVIDRTEQREAAEALRQSEEKYRNLVETSIDGVLILQDGNIRYANGVARRALGMEHEELVGRSFLEFVAPEQLPQIVEIHRRRMAGERVPPRFESVVCARGGTRMEIEASAAMVTYEGRPAVLLLTRDITERKRMEEQVLRARNLESLGVLAGGIAHDFNNIVTAVLANLALARMEIEDAGVGGGAPQKRLLEAESACLRARELNEQLLTFAKGGAPVTRSASVAELVREAAANVLRGSNVRAELRLPTDLWPVRIDVGQMHQVLANLIVNAQQAMPDGGVVHITAENLDDDAAAALHLPVRRHVRLSVADHGLGIAPEHLERIFDPYFTTRPGGSGLGLATTYSIVNRHGGRVEVESQLGKGTTFRICLPASRATPGKFPAARRLPAVPSGRVLLMDDDDGLRRVTADLLRKHGLKVETAADGAEALQCWIAERQAGRPFAAAILDLTVAGGMGGQECLRRILAVDPSAKAIVSSGYSNDPVMAEWKTHGFAGAAAKPYRVEELLEVLGRVLAN